MRDQFDRNMLCSKAARRYEMQLSRYIPNLKRDKQNRLPYYNLCHHKYTFY